MIGCSGELNQSEYLYVDQKGAEDMEGMEGMTYVGVL